MNSKKLFSILLVAVFVIALLPIGIFAEEEVIDSGSCGNDLTWTLDGDGTLTISGTGRMPDYTTKWGYPAQSSCPWNAYQKTIQALVVKSGVLNISDNAFYQCPFLATVQIEEGLISIGKNAFYQCTGIKELILPSSLQEIGDSAFYCCVSVASFSLPDGIVRIDNRAFAGCGKMNQVTLPSGLSVLESELFSGCESLSEILIPATIAEIKAGVFQGCKNLMSVHVPVSAVKIYGSAFSGCQSLRDIYYEGTKEQWDQAFIYDANQLLNNTRIHFSDDSSVFIKVCGREGQSINWVISEDNVLNIYGTGEMGYYSVFYSRERSPYQSGSGDEIFPPWYAYLDTVEKVVISPGITTISACTFGSHKGQSNAIKSVVVPDTVKQIGSCAFTNCSSLTEIVIPNSVESLGYRIFDGCTGLNSAVLSQNIKELPDYAFGDCVNLTSLDIPDNVTKLGEYSLAGCTKLKDIRFPANIEQIGIHAFDVIPYWQNKNNWDGNLLYMNNWLIHVRGTPETLNVKDGTTLIAATLFSNNPKLKSVSLPESLKVLGGFANCTKLESITIPDSVVSISDYAFYNCSSLKTIKLPQSLTHIGEAAFSNTGLVQIEIPNNVSEICSGAFGACGELVSVSLPNSINRLENSLFYGCRKLEAVDIPTGVQSIGTWTFRDCPSLKRISIPATVVEMGVGDVLVGPERYPQHYNDPDNIFYSYHYNTDINTIIVCEEDSYAHKCALFYNWKFCLTNAHEWTDARTEPTCTQNGALLHVCQKCGTEELYETIPALGHDFGIWIIKKQATATESGLITRTCSRCGETEDAVVAADPSLVPISEPATVIPSSTAVLTTEIQATTALATAAPTTVIPTSIFLKQTCIIYVAATISYQSIYSKASVYLVSIFKHIRIISYLPLPLPWN